MPVSDNGGSTSEIMRVLGGPAIGDIRSRLLRVARRDTPQQEAVFRFWRFNTTFRMLFHLTSHLIHSAHPTQLWYTILES